MPIIKVFQDDIYQDESYLHVITAENKVMLLLKDDENRLQFEMHLTSATARELGFYLIEQAKRSEGK